ncbi:IS110 family transposase [Streptomyces mirabilis]|uniref:IS110 family transposase n=1 Tax=Streptomyces mirabilis TaxID=68239 RepID=UPI00369C1B28
MVLLGVDPHKSTHTAAAVAPDSQQQLSSVTIRASLPEYRRLLRWARQWPRRTWAVENANGLDRHLVQWLIARGEHVIDVPATATSQVRELSRGGGRKNDQIDAAAAAIVAHLHGDGREVEAENHSTALALLDERRVKLTQARVRAINQLHALLRDLLPGGARDQLSAGQAAALLRAVRPVGAVAAGNGPGALVRAGGGGARLAGALGRRLGREWLVELEADSHAGPLAYWARAVVREQRAPAGSPVRQGRYGLWWVHSAHRPVEVGMGLRRPTVSTSAAGPGARGRCGCSRTGPGAATGRLAGRVDGARSVVRSRVESARGQSLAVRRQREGRHRPWSVSRGNARTETSLFRMWLESVTLWAGPADARTIRAVRATGPAQPSAG